MIGIDIADISRFSEIKDKETFYARTFTDAERKYLAEKNWASQSVAGIFAAKEAVAKALGTGFADGVTLQGIEILHRPSGVPYVVLHGAAQEIFAADLDGTRLEVTISHSRAQAVAVAVIL